MAFATLNCPNCGGAYNPINIKCEYCGSIIIMSNENQYNVPQQIIESVEADVENCPGVYVFGTLLGKGETPIRLGSANYYKNAFFNVGGKVLLTKRSIQFSTHTFMQSKDTVVIPLKDVIKAEYDRSNLGISDQISVYTNEKRHKFVVYGGSEWVSLIEKSKAEINNIKTSVVNSQKAGKPMLNANNDYTDELIKLKKLLDSGIITEEEFAIKKRQLLNI